MIKIVTLKEAEEEIDRQSKEIEVTNQSIILHGLYPYCVDFKRCDTPEKILHWVAHLCNKTWATNTMIRNFVLAAGHKINLDVWAVNWDKVASANREVENV